MWPPPLFSPTKVGPKEDNEVTIITEPLKWSERRLKDRTGQIFQVLLIPDNCDGQIKFSCLLAKMVYTPGKRQTLVGAIHATNGPTPHYKNLLKVQFQVEGAQPRPKSESESDGTQYD
jgi:hypothetical protein